jgi:hypothetical protein
MANSAWSRDNQTPLGVPQHGFHLGARHPREPFEEVVDSCPIFQILKQSSDRDTCAFEQPLAANFAWLAFHGFT